MTDRVVPRRGAWCHCLLLSLACWWAGEACAQVLAHPDRQQAWLVTYGPGEAYWERFGHNAIWIRDPRTGLDHTFNFGYFDFAQERFLSRFVQGRMLYFSMAQPAATEFAQYRDSGRSIRIQRLALSRPQFRALRDHLQAAVRPENRNYRYDYYRDNCSTRVRDAIDLALGGALRAWSSPQPAAQTFRDHTRRLTSPVDWLYLGTEVPLGRRIDQPITLWDEFFIPAVMADAVAGSRWVMEDQALQPATIPPPPAEPTPRWPRYAVVGGLLALLLMAGARSSFATGDRLTIGWLALTGAGGAFLSFAWFGTDHWAAGENANLALLNPLWLLALVPALRRLIGLLVLAGIGFAAWWHFAAREQYLLDILVLVGPLNAVAAGWLAWYGGRGSRKAPTGSIGAWEPR